VLDWINAQDDHAQAVFLFSFWLSGRHRASRNSLIKIAGDSVNSILVYSAACRLRLIAAYENGISGEEFFEEKKSSP
jgi:hypothetical protein